MFAIVAASIGLHTRSASAELIEAYLPAGIPGFGQQRGVTVLTRLRPEYDSAGVRVGGFDLQAALDEGIGYNSNVVADGRGSIYISTAPSVAAVSNGGRTQVGISVTANNLVYLNTHSLDRTDWTASLGGATLIGNGNLSGGYSHQAISDVGVGLGQQITTTYIPVTIDDLKLAFTYPVGRFRFTPNVDEQYITFGRGRLGNVTLDQTSLTRNVLSGGVTTAYSLAEQKDLLLVLQGIDTHYTKARSGQPSPDSQSIEALAGVDVQANGLFRYRLLGGVENRSYTASIYASTTSPIIEASVVYTPTGLTTLTGTVSREIEDPTTAGIGGYTYTNIQFVVDHELRRNILLQGRVGYQIAEYIGGNAYSGGTQTSVNFGASVSWLISRNLRMALSYTYVNQSSIGQQQTTTTTIGQTGATLTGAYTQSVFGLTAHIAL